MIRVKVRDPGAELIVDTPAMANQEATNGGRVTFASAGWSDDGDVFHTVVGFEGKNNLGVTEVSHRVGQIGDLAISEWSRATIDRGTSKQYLHVDGDVQARTSTYDGKYGVELIGSPDPQITDFMSVDSMAVSADLEEI
jgi:hypothetical protein